MQDEVLTNILNMLQNDSSTKNSGSDVGKNTNTGFNNDLQGMLIKMLLSGQLNNLFTPKPKEPESTPIPPTPRTINLENYKRLD